MKKEMLRVPYRSSHHRYSIKKVFLKISPNSQKNTCVRVSFLIKLQALTCNFIKKETLTQMLSCELCVIFKSTYFTEHLRVTASGRICSDNTSTNNCPQLLTRFVPLTFFSNPENIRKPNLWFSVFSGGIEIDKRQKRVNRIIATLKKFSRPPWKLPWKILFKKICKPTAWSIF